MELILHSYQGREIAFDPSAKMWNLNAMHQAAGSERSKEPSRWLTQVQTQEFLKALTEEETTLDNGSISVLIETREGRSGGTWAHWQIAAAYAHYLNPRFYIQWNRWAMAYSQSQQQTSVSASQLATIITRIDTLEAEVAALRANRTSVSVPREPKALEDRKTRDLYREPIPVKAVMAVLRAANAPLSPMDVYMKLRDQGYGPEQVRHRLNRLASRGKLNKMARGLYELPKKN
jgi:hypothetical protein